MRREVSRLAEGGVRRGRAVHGSMGLVLVRRVPLRIEVLGEGAEVAKSTYTQQHTLGVGDVPGHQIRIYKIHRTYPNDKPNCEGLGAPSHGREVILTTSIGMAQLPSLG
jgi:hypothetical protein